MPQCTANDRRTRSRKSLRVPILPSFPKVRRNIMKYCPDAVVREELYASNQMCVHCNEGGRWFSLFLFICLVIKISVRIIITRRYTPPTENWPRSLTGVLVGWATKSGFMQLISIKKLIIACYQRCWALFSSPRQIKL